MKKVIINGFAWYYEESTGYFYENEDKTGSKIHQANKHFTDQETRQVLDQLNYAQPMIKHFQP